MLTKLMKHEFRATGRVMLPVYLVLLITAIGSNLSVRLMDSTDVLILNIFCGLILMAFVVAMIAIWVITVVVMVQRFRKNLLGDEGYIMMTLPVSTHAQIWSKLLVSVVWFLATAVAMALACFVMAFRADIVADFFKTLGELLSMIPPLRALNAVGLTLMAILTYLVGAAMSVLMFYAAMGIGNSFANHKTLISVASFFGIQFATQMITTTLMTVCGNVFISWLDVSLNGYGALYAGMAILIAGMVLFSAAYYAVTHHMLEKNLNLD